MSEAIEPELWSDETIAEFPPNNAMDNDGYLAAIEEVLRMGIDPKKLNPNHLFRDEPWRRPELYVESESYSSTLSQKRKDRWS